MVQEDGKENEISVNRTWTWSKKIHPHLYYANASKCICSITFGFHEKSCTTTNISIIICINQSNIYLRSVYIEDNWTL